ncbi:hypothetical protein WISP_18774 [Willisornis vidua]|uniref:Breast cancer susceptibility 1 n=1 Tax=Willisornis vidua TaxID=1566151 RepID=A0ABQ9DS32_9PASS|nr:hypothetical protein WISP_18774 [Willisornis vidua]
MNPFLKKPRKAISTSRVRRQPFAEGEDETYLSGFIMSHNTNLAFQEVQGKDCFVCSNTNGDRLEKEELNFKAKLLLLLVINIKQTATIKTTRYQLVKESTNSQTSSTKIQTPEEKLASNSSTLAIVKSCEDFGKADGYSEVPRIEGRKGMWAEEEKDEEEILGFHDTCV